MPYAIYALSWKQEELHHDFVSRKKTPAQVWGDVITYLNEYYNGSTTDCIDDKAELQKTQDELHAFILKELPNWSLVTLEVMDEDTEGRLDEMFEFINRYHEYYDDFSFIENREACVLMSRLVFGIRRMTDQRLSRFWVEGPQDVKDQQQADFIHFSNHLRCFNALRRTDFDSVKFNELTESWSGPPSILKDPVNNVNLNAHGEYIWWTNQGDCEGVMAYHEKCRIEGMIPWGGPLRDQIYSELRSRHGRHAAGTVWGLKTQPTFNQTNDFHRYIIKYCGGILISYGDLMTIRHQQGFVTDLNLKPIWELK